MYRPDPTSQFRVKFDFRVDFTNGGHVEGKDFLLDLQASDVSDDQLKKMTVEAMNLATAGKVTIYRRKIIRRGEHADA